LKNEKEQDLDSTCCSGRSIVLVRLFFLVVLSAFVLPSARSQTQGSTGQPNFDSPSDLIRMSEPTPQELARRKLLAAQRIRHQKEMAVDVTRLLILANELKSEAQNGSGNVATDAEKARQIEKLARRVQLLMREAGEV
jgi:hypothetical protein